MKRKIKMFKWFENKSIRTKIIIIDTLMFSFVFLFLSIFIIVNTFQFYNYNAKKELSNALRTISEHIKRFEFITEQDIHNMIDAKNIKVIIIKNGEVIINFLDKHNNLFLKYEESFNEKNFIKLSYFKEKDWDRDRNFDIKIAKIKGLKYMYLKDHFIYKNNNYFIQVFKPNYEEDKIIKNFFLIFVIANVLAIFSSYFISKIVSKSFLNIIKNISETTENINVNDLSKRIKIPEYNDEMSQLIRTINDMISKLENYVNNQKQFISDASHELRTPISVIKGYTDLIDRWGKNDPKVLEESIDSIKNETEHMTNLIRKLMFLARENDIEFNLTIVFLNEIIEDICKDIKIIKEDLLIDLEIDDEIYIQSDESLIKQMIWIFLDNSIKYCDKKEIKIKIKLFELNQNIFICIEDNGKGIPEEEIKFIFDRFYRIDKSRTKEISGCGLGLSIAKLIVSKHNGDISVVSEISKGSKFTIRLPKNIKKLGG